MFKFEEYKLRYLDFRLIIYVLILAGAGTVFVKSATLNAGNSAFYKQIAGLVIGAAAMMVVSLMDYHFWLKTAPVIYICSILLLISVWMPKIGYSNGEATRWVTLPGVGRIQPSEFAKVGLILSLAAYFYHFQEKVSSVPVVIGSVALYAGIGGLIFKEPDLSTTLVTAFIFVVMIYVSGISYKWVLGVLAVCVPIVGVVIYILLQPDQSLISGWQMNRITAWLHPDQVSSDLTRQTRYSIQAIASGQLHGKGLFNTTLESVKNGNFLSEESCDFIFAVIGEETGFIGSIIIILLLAFVVFECIWIGIHARDLAGRLICVGMGGLIAFQTFVNVGVVTGILPNTGLPLPFLSAGLSSLISLMIGMGVVINVGLQRKKDNT
jgi:rod shape determining protein RodA